MPRVSRAQAELNHQRVIDEAARLVREHGAEAVSIPQVMSAAGLTPGGFYKRFSSKEDLVARAGEAAFARRLADLTAAVSAASSDDDRSTERRRYLRRYLSPAHRDSPGAGCAAVALAADAARAEPDHPLRDTYVDGVRRMAEGLDALEPGGHEGEVRPGVLVDIATIVGAVVLARATTGDDLSERVLAAVREHLLDDDDDRCRDDDRRHGEVPGTSP